ncbi:hypothetical protein K1719_044121 [Acacia pycnantha]|nr:hypothetical protein K1719_044121 [Acacia pycnantha]
MSQVPHLGDKNGQTRGVSNLIVVEAEECACSPSFLHLVIVNYMLSCRFWPHLNYLNYGDFIFDRKGILSSVYLD